MISLTLSLPTNCITDAVSFRDHSPEKAQQTKISAWGTLYDVRIRENVNQSSMKSYDVI